MAELTKNKITELLITVVIAIACPICIPVIKERIEQNNGELVTEDDDDSVVGYLTAADVVKRVEAWLERRKNEKTQTSVQEV